MIIIPIKWLFHWEYTLFSDKPICSVSVFTSFFFPWDLTRGCDGWNLEPGTWPVMCLEQTSHRRKTSQWIIPIEIHAFPRPDFFWGTDQALLLRGGNPKPAIDVGQQRSLRQSQLASWFSRFSSIFDAFLTPKTTHFPGKRHRFWMISASFSDLSF